jgi:hypothetical protein
MTIKPVVTKNIQKPCPPPDTFGAWGRWFLHLPGGKSTKWVRQKYGEKNMI